MALAAQMLKMQIVNRMENDGGSDAQHSLPIIPLSQDLILCPHS
jgi:hypothetical protein